MSDLTRAGEALLAELQESPLPGARYAFDVVRRRLPAIVFEARAMGPDHSEAIAKNLATIAELEAEAIHVHVSRVGRIFVMPDGRLLTIRNEQPASSPVLHFMAILEVSWEDAADVYGFVRP